MRSNRFTKKQVVKNCNLVKGGMEASNLRLPIDMFDVCPSQHIYNCRKQSFFFYCAKERGRL